MLAMVEVFHLWVTQGLKVSSEQLKFRTPKMDLNRATKNF